VEIFCGILPAAAERMRAAAASYAKWWGEEFALSHDPSGVLGESNVFRYRRRGRILVRSEGMTPEEVALVLLAARTCGVKVLLSAGSAQEECDPLATAANVRWRVEADSELCAGLRSGGKDFERIRTVNPSADLRQAAHEEEMEIVDWPVLANGRIELLHYLREQVVSETRHRYGNIMAQP